MARPSIRKNSLAVYNHWAAGKRDNRAFRDHGNPGPNAANVNYINTARGRVHDAIRNTPFAVRAIEILTTDIVGSGIVPRAADSTIGDLLKEWCWQCDAEGQRDLYGIQESAIMAWAEGGESFIRLRPRRPGDGLVVPLQLQVLESEMLPLLDQELTNGNSIRQGIELNRIGQRVAYWFHKAHPGDFYTGGISITQLTRVPADAVLHIYEARRPGQLRGFPRLAPVLQRIQQFSDMDEATIERQKQASNITFVITRPVPEAAGIDPVTGLAIEDDREVSDVAPGSAYRLFPGEDMKTADLPSVGGEYDHFTTWQARQISAGAGVPYELLTNDFRSVNDRTARIILEDHRRRMRQHQQFRLVHPALRPIAAAFIDAAIMMGLASPTVDRRVPWVPPAWPYIHPVQDVTAAEREVRAGFDSRRHVVISRGRDPDDVRDENILDTAEDRRHGLSYTTGLAEETDLAAQARETSQARAQALHDGEMRVRAAQADQYRAGRDLATAQAARERAEASWREANAELAQAQAAREKSLTKIAAAESKAKLALDGRALDARLEALAQERDQTVRESRAREAAAKQSAQAAANEAAARSQEERLIQAERLAVAKLEHEAAAAGLAELRGGS